MAERLLALGEKGRHQCDMCFKFFPFVGNGEWIPTTCPACIGKVNRFYDYTGELTSGGEGILVQLCRRCARRCFVEGHDIEWASAGDEESECEECDQKNRDAV